jgi:hypothetical protein
MVDEQIKNGGLAAPSYAQQDLDLLQGHFFEQMGQDMPVVEPGVWFALPVFVLKKEYLFHFAKLRLVFN